jgi:prophage regulatory protein
MTQKGSPPKVRRFLRLSAVMEATGYRRTRLYELVASGEFPKPIKLSSTGHAVAWNEDELVAWQEARLAARDGEAA